MWFKILSETKQKQASQTQFKDCGANRENSDLSKQEL
jgi:hypothetical protein